jgi:hypothetical protein
MLELDNSSYLVAYLEQDALRWRHASGKPSATDFALLASPLYADGSEPVPRDLPYASQRCDLATEVRKAHGQRIQTLSTGDDTFNPAFADGHELDAMIVTAADGRRALRVFWEQW